MSSGQKPRNPAYFPKMKVRGVSRRRNGNGGWEILPGAGAVLKGLGLSATQVAQAFERFGERFKIDGT